MRKFGHSAAQEPRVTGCTASSGAFDIVAVPIDPTQATVQLAGEVDITTADLVTAALTEQLADGRRFVRLDLSRLAFMDGAGLRALVQAHNEFLFAGGTLVLTGLGHRINRLLHITHLDEALFVADEPGEPARPGRTRHLRCVHTEAGTA